MVPKTSCQFRFESDSISPYVSVHFVRYLLCSAVSLNSKSMSKKNLRPQDLSYKMVEI